MEFCDFAQLAGTRRTADGYLIAEVRAARTGIQQYQARELGREGGIVNVYRPENVVFDRASLATYAGKPVTLGHPPENVSAQNWKRYAVGDIGTDIARDGEFVRVPLKLMDADAIAAVLGGTREISMGYTTDIRWENGVASDGTPYQAVLTGPLRINHLALVSKARGGAALRFGDAAVPISTFGGSNMNDHTPPGFFRDAYGRLLATGTGAERDRVEGFRIARDAMLADAWRQQIADAPAQSADTKPAVLDAQSAHAAYVSDLANAWKRQDPDLSDDEPAAFNGKRRRQNEPA